MWQRVAPEFPGQRLPLSREVVFLGASAAWLLTRGSLQYMPGGGLRARGAVRAAVA